MTYANNGNTPRVYTIKRAALKLDCSTRTIWRLIRDDKIRWIQLTPRRKAIPAEEIERIAMEGVAA